MSRVLCNCFHNAYLQVCSLLYNGFNGHYDNNNSYDHSDS